MHHCRALTLSHHSAISHSPLSSSSQPALGWGGVLHFFYSHPARSDGSPGKGVGSPLRIEVRDDAATIVDVRGAALDAHRARSDGSPGEGVESPLRIEAPDDAASIVGAGGAAYDALYARSDVSLREGAEPPRQLEVPDDAAGIPDFFGAAFHAHHFGSDGSSREGVEPPSRIEAPDDAPSIVGIRQLPDARAGVGPATDLLVSDDSVIGKPPAGVERPRKVEVPDSYVGIVGVSQSPEARAHVGLVPGSAAGEDPVIGEAARASAPDAEHPSAEEVATTVRKMVMIRVDFRPGDEVGGASPAEPTPGIEAYSFC